MAGVIELLPPSPPSLVEGEVRLRRRLDQLARRRSCLLADEASWLAPRRALGIIAVCLLQLGEQRRQLFPRRVAVHLRATQR